MIERLARWAVVLTVVPAALMSFAYLSGDIDTWWIELLHYVPYPAYLLPALAALGLSMRLRWPWRVAASGTVALVLTVLMGLVVGHADTGSLPVRMMTYNVKAHLAVGRGIGFGRLAQELAAHDPDIVVMQDAIELGEAHQAVPPRDGGMFGDRNVYVSGQYIVATRFPMRDCRTLDMSYGRRPARFVHCVVTAHGMDVDLYTAHLLSPRQGLNATRREPVEGIDDWQQNFADRLLQARRIAAALASSGEAGGARTRPVILAGDLNAAEASPVIRTLLATGLRDAFSSAGIGYGYSHGHALKVGFSFLRIDHILVSPDIGVVDARPGGWQASEHRPVIADLLLRRSAG